MTKRPTEKLVAGSAGCFLDPPSFPTHRWHIETDCNRHKENRGSISLTYAAECSWLPECLRNQAQAMINSWKQDNPFFNRQDPELLDWAHQCLGYFRNCWLDERLDLTAARKCENLIIDPKPEATPDNVLLMRGVDHIREFFPSFLPTAEDLDSAYWGSKA